MLIGPEMPSAGKTGRISGRYTTRFEQLSFTYEATWRETDDGVVWTAVLKRDELLVATPTGQIRHAVGIDLTDEVRRLVEDAIEARADQK